MVDPNVIVDELCRLLCGLVCLGPTVSSQKVGQFDGCSVERSSPPWLGRTVGVGDQRLFVLLMGRGIWHKQCHSPHM